MYLARRPNYALKLFKAALGVRQGVLPLWRPTHLSPLLYLHHHDAHPPS